MGTSIFITLECVPSSEMPEPHDNWYSEELPDCFLKQLHRRTFPPAAMHEGTSNSLWNMELKNKFKGPYFLVSFCQTERNRTDLPFMYDCLWAVYEFCIFLGIAALATSVSSFSLVALKDSLKSWYGWTFPKHHHKWHLLLGGKYVKNAPQLEWNMQCLVQRTWDINP